MAVKDKFFASKNAYLFQSKEKVLIDYLFKELTYQLGHLEMLWLAMSTQVSEANHVLTQDKRLALENISFRLKEIICFIKKNEGPKIIGFVCGEIEDLIEEKFIMQTMLNDQEYKQVSLILTVMKTYFQPDILGMEIVDIEIISADLKQAVNALLDRLL